MLCLSGWLILWHLLYFALCLICVFVCFGCCNCIDCLAFLFWILTVMVCLFLMFLFTLLYTIELINSTDLSFFVFRLFTINYCWFVIVMLFDLIYVGWVLVVCLFDFWCFFVGFIDLINICLNWGGLFFTVICCFLVLVISL